MVDLKYFFCFEVDKINFVLFNVVDDYLLIGHHCKVVDDAFVGVFEQNLSIRAEMNDAFF